MKPACTHDYFIEIMADTPMPAVAKGDLLVTEWLMCGSYAHS